MACVMFAPKGLTGLMRPAIVRALERRARIKHARLKPGAPAPSLTDLAARSDEP
jgi:hypothetical protein